jgi:hypothetical protein
MSCIVKEQLNKRKIYSNVPCCVNKNTSKRKYFSVGIDFDSLAAK